MGTRRGVMAGAVAWGSWGGLGIGELLRVWETREE